MHDAGRSRDNVLISSYVYQRQMESRKPLGLVADPILSPCISFSQATSHDAVKIDSLSPAMLRGNSLSGSTVENRVADIAGTAQSDRMI